MEAVAEVELLPHQVEFVSDVDTRYLGLVGGYGSGKTWSFCVKAIHIASLNVGFRGVLLEPTNAMVSDVLIPEFEEVLYQLQIPFKFRRTPYPQYDLQFGHGTTQVLLRSAENYRRLAGLNLAFFGVDECDLIDRETAWAMWRILQSRLRSGEVYQGFTTSTPEGFNFLYDFFVKEKEERDRKGQPSDRRHIKAKTRDNPFLPDTFIDDLMETYPEQLIKAYLEGEFVNLNSGRVYYQFDRHVHHCDITAEDYPNHVLHVGQDFNVNKMASVVHIVVDGKPYAVDELLNVKNTKETISALKERYPNRHIIIYPDSSGKHESSSTSATDILLLREAGFDVRYRTKNPPVKSRLGSMNAMFLNAKGEVRYRVNTKKCPNYTESLEQQVYDKNGKPDKSGDLDHPVDAAGYFIHYQYPMTGKPQVTTY